MNYECEELMMCCLNLSYHSKSIEKHIADLKNLATKGTVLDGNWWGDWFGEWFLGLEAILVFVLLGILALVCLCLCIQCIPTLTNGASRPEMVTGPRGGACGIR